MLVEVHILQNFAPSNLNRDDTGAPKDCIFGGYRRARVSSQCWKRAARMYFETKGLLPPENLSQRTRRLVSEVADRVKHLRPDLPVDSIPSVVVAALQSVQLEVEKDLKTQYLLFLGKKEIAAFAKACCDHWTDLEVVAKANLEETSGQTGKSKGKSKRQLKAAIPKPIQQKVEALFDGGQAVSVTLFGRMVADEPRLGIDAACQVAHAISVNKVDTEFDYFTAVDDLPSEEESGAGMIGSVEFNSACYYRYANVDVGQLMQNLQLDSKLSRLGLGAFLEAFALSVPSGKQNGRMSRIPLKRAALQNL